MKELFIEILILYLTGVIIFSSIVFFLYHIPVKYMVDLQTIAVVDEDYLLYRKVNFINLEARSRQNLYCADDGHFIGYRNTDYFGMRKGEPQPITVPFSLKKFEILSERECDEMYLKVQYYLRSEYFKEKFYPDVLISNNFQIN